MPLPTPSTPPSACLINGHHHDSSRAREVGTEAGPVQAVLQPMTFGNIELLMGAVSAVASMDRYAFI